MCAAAEIHPLPPPNCPLPQQGLWEPLMCTMKLPVQIARDSMRTAATLQWHLLTMVLSGDSPCMWPIGLDCLISNFLIPLPMPPFPLFLGLLSYLEILWIDPSFADIIHILDSLWDGSSTAPFLDNIQLDRRQFPIAPNSILSFLCSFTISFSSSIVVAFSSLRFLHL